MISIIDYGMGNCGSIQNMLRYLGVECRLIKNPGELDLVDAIILPGVGSFDNGMRKLSPFKNILTELVNERKVPFLGICLGMQLIFEKSEEGVLPGLGWLKGDVVKFDFSGQDLHNNLKVPHMGWNLVNPIADDKAQLFFPGEARYYFVHSYHVRCENESDRFASSTYGYDFTCAVRKNNIWGAQFHPEKSHKFGFHFFKSFLQELNNA
ncbi:imidazole glycerol phosphate synthase subunit HisH [Alishewanella sp. BS5-314]|uniref:imidazole glycerol phosphate synthase subunit HisH n=1 Tax=Alishewanella sp. BS5-314 TaxID=2755587 RepID=UPI0021BB0B88|nr:imidazole glycerol phosphate synthase subunit HisH [Alishewanella sp. BS5-314]MCT8126386.1 imidazole glycerol phosphate synthase subunit HisH [Alishewanella sp. BS5-314]